MVVNLSTDMLHDLSPVEFIGDMLFKREDKFAPLGYGGINGSKVRQCIWLVDNYVADAREPLGLVSGASVKSSQLAVGTIIAASYNLPSIHVIGATTPTSAINHEQVRIAHHFGAEFVISKVAYNPALQRKVNDLVEGDLKGWFKLEYGSSLNHKTNPPELVAEFHGVGATQVENIPNTVDTLIIPTGSCNTLVSVLYGISWFNKPIKKVICLQIGPDKKTLTDEKLNVIDEVISMKAPPLRSIPREYHYLNERWSYQDDVPFNYNGVEMHPTYEGKCFKYLSEHPELMNDHTCFWLTGSKPWLRNMVPEDPQYNSIKVWDGTKARV